MGKMRSRHIHSIHHSQQFLETAAWLDVIELFREGGCFFMVNIICGNRLHPADHLRLSREAVGHTTAADDSDLDIPGRFSA